jgi:hypothetical protein
MIPDKKWIFDYSHTETGRIEIMQGLQKESFPFLYGKPFIFPAILKKSRIGFYLLL